MDGEKFPSVEHYFQAMKAKEFKDDEIYNKIIKTKTSEGREGSWNESEELCNGSMGQ
jgi:predicted NAD-dependent protein-ADP-ribosyltransferase YbiA (DUF1768 family)